MVIAFHFALQSWKNWACVKNYIYYLNVVVRTKPDLQGHEIQKKLP